MASVSLVAAGATPIQAAPAGGIRCVRRMVGAAAVLVGAFISTVNTRITTIGLADIRGALGYGFDEGSWVTTVFSAAQMMVAPGAAWLGMVFGARRFLLWASIIFALSSLLPPFARDYDTVIPLQFVRGLTVGTFIPSALGFTLRRLPPLLWTWSRA